MKPLSSLVTGTMNRSDEAVTHPPDWVDLLDTTQDIYSDQQRMEEFSSQYFAHENGIYHRLNAWWALTVEERAQWRERTRQHMAEYEKMPDEWRRKSHDEARKKILAINDAEYERIRGAAPLNTPQNAS